MSQNATPRISVVTVSFNARDCIGATLRSVCGQDYPALDYIVIDGGSTDGTQEVIAPFRDRIAHYVSEPDGGIYFGMNKGIAAATGDFLLFLNAGDVFSDAQVLSDTAAFISAHPEADVIYGDSEQVLEYGSYRIKPQAPFAGNKIGVSHQATFVRTALLRLHPFDTRYRYAADSEQLSWFYLEGYPFVYFDRLIATVEMRDGATYRHFVESANELYDIIEARGIDVSRERKVQIRRKKFIRAVRNFLPPKLRNPLFRFLARHYKVL